jgi:hypothetical protein
MKIQDTNVATTLTGLAPCLDAGCLPLPVRNNEVANARHRAVDEAICWMPVALVLAHVRRVEERPLSSMGLRRPSWRGEPIAMLFAIALVAPWDWSHLIVAAFGRRYSHCVYLWRRSLWANIAAHCIVDRVAFLSRSQSSFRAGTATTRAHASPSRSSQ